MKCSGLRVIGVAVAVFGTYAGALGTEPGTTFDTGSMLAHYQQRATPADKPTPVQGWIWDRAGTTRLGPALETSPIHIPAGYVGQVAMKITGAGFTTHARILARAGTDTVAVIGDAGSVDLFFDQGPITGPASKTPPAFDPVPEGFSGSFSVTDTLAEPETMVYDVHVAEGVEHTLVIEVRAHMDYEIPDDLKVVLARRALDAEPETQPGKRTEVRVPAPGACTLLGVGAALVTGRRRRR